MTQIITKPFDPLLYNQSDGIAKRKVRELVVGKNFILEKPEDEYAVDFYVYRNEKHVGNLETEIKYGWIGKEYPFIDVRFPYRKKKFTELSVPTVFIMFNNDLSEHLCVTDKVLSQSPVLSVSNSELDDENFFIVSLEKVHFNWLHEWQ